MTEDLTAAEMVARNSHELTAHLLVTARAEHAETIRQYHAHLDAVRANITRAERIGLAVLRAHDAGRKTLRIADLLEDGAA